MLEQFIPPRDSCNSAAFPSPICSSCMNKTSIAVSAVAVAALGLAGYEWDKVRGTEAILDVLGREREIVWQRFIEYQAKSSFASLRSPPRVRK